MNVNIHKESVAPRCSVEKVFLAISQNLQENTCARVSFLIKLQALGLAQVFSCEFCEISNNTFIYRTPPAAVSVHRLPQVFQGLLIFGHWNTSTSQEKRVALEQNDPFNIYFHLVGKFF